MFNDLYAAAQFASALSLLMVACLYFVRAIDALRGREIFKSPVLIVALAVHMTAIAAKQWLWTSRGILVAADIDAQALVNYTPVSALVLNIAIAMSAIWIYWIVAAQQGRHATTLVTGGAAILLVVSWSVGRYGP